MCSYSDSICKMTKWVELTLASIGGKIKTDVSGKEMLGNRIYPVLDGLYLLSTG